MTFDWPTFGLETVNVLILVWLLARFFWRPLAAMIAQRRQMAQALLDEAKADRDSAAKALEEAQSRRAGFAEEREAILAKAWKEAEAARGALLKKAETETAALREQSRAALAHEEEEAARIWSDRAGELALTIAGKLAARLDGAAVNDAFLHWLTGKIAALPEDIRAAIGTADEVEVLSAAALDPAQQQSVGAEIGAALGATPRLAFKTDPDLIAGLELRTPHFAVTNSWRSDLAQILTELNHDQRV